MPRPKKFIFITLALAFFLCAPASAHQPIIDPGDSAQMQGTELNLQQAYPVLDPTEASEAVYSALKTPSQVMLYRFTAKTDGVVPIEVLVPVREANADFRPFAAVISKSVISNQPVPFTYPAGYSAYVIAPSLGERLVFYEPYSMEDLYHGTEVKILVKAGEEYFIAVYDENRLTGDYALGLGEVENFKNTSFLSLLKNVLLIKLGLVGGRQVPWLDMAGYFLFIAGFIVGLGAVTVIDWLGFLGRKSGYWTRASIAAHKVTKPLIWTGLFLAAIGAIIVYRRSGLTGTGLLHLVLGVIAVLNGLYLTFRVSPYLLKKEREGTMEIPLETKWQVKIAISFVISFFSWWLAVFLLVWHTLFIK